MRDRELLELAAKAAGFEYECTAHTGYPEDDQHQIRNEAGTLVDWNPLENDGDALRLAVRLQLQITPGTYNKDEFTAFNAGHGEAHEYQSYMQDEYAATRRAIVRAAAEIGKQMEMGQ